MEVDVFMNFMRLGKVAHGADTWLGSIDWIDVTGFNAKVSRAPSNPPLRSALSASFLTDLASAALLLPCLCAEPPVEPPTADPPAADPPAAHLPLA